MSYFNQYTPRDIVEGGAGLFQRILDAMGLGHITADTVILIIVVSCFLSLLRSLRFPPAITVGGSILLFIWVWNLLSPAIEPILSSVI